ncbi:Ig-like domain repeat protein, partial [Methanobrevibacter sp.]
TLDTPVANGKGSIELSDLKVEGYSINAKFENENYTYADGKYMEVYETGDIEIDIKPTKTPTYSIHYPSDATGNLTVTVNGKTYTAELVNGSASITIPNLPAGEYEVTVSYSGDAKYEPVTKTAKTTVKVDPKIVAKNAAVQYCAGKYYNVRIYGDNGKVAANTPVTFMLNGKKIASAKTDSKGVARFKITQTPVTKGKLVTKALGVSATKTLTIKRVLALKAVAIKKSAKKLVLQATLKKVNGKYLKGKKITFKFNGKKYAAKTNKKGVAKVTIKKSVLNKLKVGKKIAYTATYIKDTVKRTTKVKR